MVSWAAYVEPATEFALMALLDEVLDACGGIERWNRLTRFTLHLSIDGELLSRRGRAGDLKDLVAEGSTRAQAVQFTGFMAPDKRGLYQPDRIALESLDGTAVEASQAPYPGLLAEAGEKPWDDLQFLYFCGVSIWNFVATPFLLTHPGVVVEELPPHHENNHVWRRLRAIFPPDIATHAPEQVFYFDETGLPRRADHALAGHQAAHYSWAHHRFCHILIPTLRRSLAIGTDGTVIQKPALVDIEVFDAFFE
jgi:hypothetical protein